MKFLYSAFFLLTYSFVFSQNLGYKKNIYEWPDKKPDILQATEVFASEDLVVINEHVKINVFDRYAQTLTKNCIIKINNENGLKKISTFTVPESFDLAADKYFPLQGRDSKTLIPYIYQFKIIYYAARVLKPDGKVINISLESKTEKTFWVDYNGTRLEDYKYHFFNKGLEVGDVIEYAYKMEFRGRYGHNLFYFHNEIPKQNTSLEIRYSPVYLFEEHEIVCNSNGADSSLVITSIYDQVKAKKTWIYNYKLNNLQAINYPLNSRCGVQLPHIYVDFKFLSFYGQSNVPFELLLFADRGPKFEWLFNSQNDSLGYQQPIYDKQHAAVRKFLTKFPADANNEVFYRLLCDSLNSQNFVSAESMRYSGNAQYSLASGEWLSRRKIVEEFMYELYWELLNEKKKTTYFVTVQDKRLGETNFKQRSEYKYEHVFLGVPDGKTTKFIIPRIRGLKYNADEFPFYVEGVNAAIMGVNYKVFDLGAFTTVGDFHHVAKVVNFIKTAGSSENENVRTETGSFKINLDSNFIHADIKENLNGQFSTIIRPLYLNDPIDSTVHPVYFKKCTDKPNAKNIRIKSTYKSNTFPFKHSFNCSEDIILNTGNEIQLANWFSFPFNKSDINQLPNFDYYFDFRYSDIYNFLLQFNKPVDIINSTDYNKFLSNSYFEINSNLVKQNETSYLLSIIVKVKQDVLPKTEGQLLLDFVDELHKLNSGVLKLK